MKMTNDFQCPDCGTVTEEYVDHNTTDVICECGQSCTKIITTSTFHLDGTDDGFPTAYEKWGNDRSSRIH